VRFDAHLTHADEVVVERRRNSTAFRALAAPDWLGLSKGDTRGRDFAPVGVEVVYRPYTFDMSSRLVGRVASARLVDRDRSARLCDLFRRGAQAFDHRRDRCPVVAAWQ
jgi:hypothetical protein